MTPEAAPPEETELDIDRELVRLRRKCTPTQRRWLTQIPLSGFKPWAAANALKINPRTVHRWLRMPHVKRYMELSREQQMQLLDFNEYSILAGYVREEQADIRKLYHPDTNDLLQPNQWPEDIARCVVESGVDAGGNRYVKIAPQRGARDQLAKYLKMFVERHEVTGKDGKPLAPQSPVIIIGGPGEEGEPDPEEPDDEAAETH